MERGRIQGLPKFGGCIYRAYPNKSPLKIFEKRERGRIQGLPKFFGYALLSQEWVKLRTSNCVGTFIGFNQLINRTFIVRPLQ